MKILVIGSGGREHALAWRLAGDAKTEKVYVAPGNAGTTITKVENVNARNQAEYIQAAKDLHVDLTIVGPEEPLVMGIADAFAKEGLTILGPVAASARIEGSKSFAKKIMQQANIPTPEFKAVYDLHQAKDVFNEWEPPYVIKVDGLAGGKGVVVTDDDEYAVEVSQHFFDDMYSASSGRILIERHVVGTEISLSVLTDGTTAICLGTAQDYKRLRDNDKGPNTGGMGAYAPSIMELRKKIDVNDLMNRFVHPILKILKERGHEYRGFLYPGLIVTDTGEIYCLEYNCRLGDPEAQVQSSRWSGDFSAACLAAANGELKEDDVIVSSDCAVGVVLASRGYPVLGRTRQMIYLPFTINNDYVYHGGTYKDEEGAVMTSAGRVATLVSVRSNLQDARDSVYKVVKEVMLEDLHYRTDIAKTLTSGE